MGLPGVTRRCPFLLAPKKSLLKLCLFVHILYIFYILLSPIAQQRL